MAVPDEEHEAIVARLESAETELAEQIEEDQCKQRDFLRDLLRLLETVLKHLPEGECRRDVEDLRSDIAGRSDLFDE